jgi:hypothetical protein
LTAYKFISRFEKDGLEGLIEHSQVPQKHPNSNKNEVVKNILNLKNEHKLWGAKKIRRLLFNICSEKDIPSVVTVHNILLKNSLVIPQKRCKRVKPVFPIFDPQECNEVWSSNYKGKFLMSNKIYCHLLTIADSKSRFVVSAKGHYNETFLNRNFAIY